MKTCKNCKHLGVDKALSSNTKGKTLCYNFESPYTFNEVLNTFDEFHCKFFEEVKVIGDFKMNANICDMSIFGVTYDLNDEMIDNYEKMKNS